MDCNQKERSCPEANGTPNSIPDGQRLFYHCPVLLSVYRLPVNILLFCCRIPIVHKAAHVSSALSLSSLRWSKRRSVCFHWQRSDYVGTSDDGPDIFRSVSSPISLLPVSLCR